mmetsp:Transcript_21094/g.34923  ORF Transcript_21094/g.34923 Transcript_21094/m.34923 type:complete len:153 (-) Transcript_21094:1050-1508(-)
MTHFNSASDEFATKNNSTIVNIGNEQFDESIDSAFFCCYSCCGGSCTPFSASSDNDLVQQEKRQYSSRIQDAISLASKQSYRIVLHWRRSSRITNGYDPPSSIHIISRQSSYYRVVYLIISRLCLLAFFIITTFKYVTKRLFNSTFPFLIPI